MAKRHAWRGIAHDRLDPFLCLTPLAWSGTILAVAFVAVRTRFGPSERLLDGSTAFRAHASHVLPALRMIALTVDAADGLEGPAIFLGTAHAASIDDGPI